MIMIVPSALLLRPPVQTPFSSTPHKRKRVKTQPVLSSVPPTAQSSKGHPSLNRRQSMFHLSVLTGILTTTSSLARANDTETPAKTAGDALIADLLARSAANKEKYNKERLDSYYRRNYQDYFNFQRSSIEAGTERGLSKELQKEILEWIKQNEKR